MPGRLTVAAALLQGARSAHRQWQAIPTAHRNRLQDLLRRSGGRPGNLSANERRELQALIGELNLGQVVRETAQRATVRRGFRRR
jgi:hypothetical protein